MKKFKAPSWEKLMELSSRWRLEGYLQRVPAKWRAAIALAASVAKWSPLNKHRGHGECGLCLR